MGSACIADGGTSFAEGDHSQAYGNASVAMGYHVTSSGQGSAALGYYTTANGQYADAIGNSTLANATAAFAQGENSVAHFQDSVAMGNSAQSNYMGSFAQASGDFSTSGDSQNGAVVEFCKTTASSGANCLAYPSNSNSTPFSCISGHTYFITYEASVDDGTNQAGWKQEQLATCVSGTAAIVSSGNQDFLASSGAAAWTMVFGTSSGNYTATFTQTGTAIIAYVTVTARFTETK
jgi:hypothetical protein